MKPNLEELQLADLNEKQEERLRELEQTFNEAKAQESEQKPEKEIYLLAFKRSHQS